MVGRDLGLAALLDEGDGDHGPRPDTTPGRKRSVATKRSGAVTSRKVPPAPHLVALAGAPDIAIDAAPPAGRPRTQARSMPGGAGHPALQAARAWSRPRTPWRAGAPKRRVMVISRSPLAATTRVSGIRHRLAPLCFALGFRACPLFGRHFLEEVVEPFERRALPELAIVLQPTRWRRASGLAFDAGRGRRWRVAGRARSGRRPPELFRCLGDRGAGSCRRGGASSLTDASPVARAAPGSPGRVGSARAAKVVSRWAEDVII